MNKPLLVATLAAAFAAVTFSSRAAASHDQVAGALVLGGIGAAVGGPPGAAVGAILGLALTDDHHHRRDYGRHYGHDDDRGHYDRGYRYRGEGRYDRGYRERDYGHYERGYRERGYAPYDRGYAEPSRYQRGYSEPTRYYERPVYRAAEPRRYERIEYREPRDERYYYRY